MPSEHQVIVDPLHGDMHITPAAKAVIDTPTFQRLRRLKQLGFAAMVYPGAVHTRFAHCLGAMHIARRVAERMVDDTALMDKLLMTALIHDIGHYPYSHLMEKVDKVLLTEEYLQRETPRPIGSSRSYPDHEELGRHILRFRDDLRQALNSHGLDSEEIASWLGKTTSDSEAIVKLIHSTLDIDRLDYLARDAFYTGTPFGAVDLKYLLNNLATDGNNNLCIREKAMSSAEHAVFARFMMYKTVYYHKTVYAFEEACRHLLHHLRRQGKIYRSGSELIEMVPTRAFLSFADEYVDKKILEAEENTDPVVRSLAQCLLSRKPPKLLGEAAETVKVGEPSSRVQVFKTRMQHALGELAAESEVPLNLFLIAQPGPLGFEERPSRITREEADNIDVPEPLEDLVRVLTGDGSGESKTLIKRRDSIVRHLAKYEYQLIRLYVVCDDDEKVAAMRHTLREWVD